MSGKLITHCQSCGSPDLELVFDAGFLPPVNTFRAIGTRPTEEIRYPAQVLRCGQCTLVQLGYQADPKVLFPTSYSYRSGTTKILRDNFADLAEEVNALFPEEPGEAGPLVVDIGSNDGSLLHFFAGRGWRVQGVEPTEARLDAEKKGIPTLPCFWDDATPAKILTWRGKAKVVTACNVFAHTPDPNTFLKAVLELLDDNGVFVCECHYLPDLLSGVQYDTIYHEHLRFYSFYSLSNLLERHGLDVISAKQIPTHGGSLRVYAGRKESPSGRLWGMPEDMYLAEKPLRHAHTRPWADFGQRVRNHKWKLISLLGNIRWAGDRVFAIGAPSRAVTLANYCGLDSSLIQCVCEVPGSPKVGGYLPGTNIPVVDEESLYREQPEFALLLSWHLADELIPKLKARDYRGRFVVPLPEPKVVE